MCDVDQLRTGVPEICRAFALRTGVVAALGIAAAACSGESGGTEQDGTRSVRGLVTVERSIAADQDSASATSVARFVDAPDSASTRDLLALAGLAQELPAEGQCQLPGVSAARALSFTEVDVVELLDAGEVSVSANGEVRRLAPHAFPDVSGVASGVMYTSRDRAEQLLPAAASYTFTTTGTHWLPALSFSATAPKDLDNVTIGGVPLAELQQLSLTTPMDVTWGVGEGEDLVYVEVASGDDVLLCAFRDDAGAGSIAASDLATLRAADSVFVSVHRTRVVEQVDPSALRDSRLSGTELRFDFELTRQVPAGN